MYAFLSSLLIPWPHARLLPTTIALAHIILFNSASNSAAQTGFQEIPISKHFTSVVAWSDSAVTESLHDIASLATELLTAPLALPAPGGRAIVAVSQADANSGAGQLAIWPNWQRPGRYYLYTGSVAAISTPSAKYAAIRQTDSVVVYVLDTNIVVAELGVATSAILAIDDDGTYVVVDAGHATSGNVSVGNGAQVEHVAPASLSNATIYDLHIATSREHTIVLARGNWGGESRIRLSTRLIDLQKDAYFLCPDDITLAPILLSELRDDINAEKLSVVCISHADSPATQVARVDIESGTVSVDIPGGADRAPIAGRVLSVSPRRTSALVQMLSFRSAPGAIPSLVLISLQDMTERVAFDAEDISQGCRRSVNGAVAGWLVWEDNQSD